MPMPEKVIVPEKNAYNAFAQEKHSNCHGCNSLEAARNVPLLPVRIGHRLHVKSPHSSSSPVGKHDFLSEAVLGQDGCAWLDPTSPKRKRAKLLCPPRYVCIVKR